LLEAKYKNKYSSLKSMEDKAMKKENVVRVLVVLPTKKDSEEAVKNELQEKLPEGARIIFVRWLIKKKQTEAHNG
jgi:hypothetical protein